MVLLISLALVLIIFILISFRKLISRQKPQAIENEIKYCPDSNKFTITTNVFMTKNSKSSLKNILNIKVDFSKFQKEDCIGRGSYGTVRFNYSSRLDLIILNST